MRTRNTAIRLGLILALGLGAGTLYFATAQEGQLTSGGAKCRRAINSSSGAYFDKVLRVYTDCYADQMAGDLPPMPTLDCSDPSTWVAGGYGDGVSAIAKQTSSAFSRMKSRCEADAPVGPGALGFVGCPAPCETYAPTLGDFSDVGKCLKCLADYCIEGVVTDLYGSPAPGLDDRAALSCQKSLGKEARKYGVKALQLRGKCQFNKDRLRPGWENVDCQAIGDSGNPMYKQFAGTLDKLEGGIAKRCDDPMLTSGLDTCGTDLNSLQDCTRDSVDTCADFLHESMYRSVPTPTPSPTMVPLVSPPPSATPTQTPAPLGRACLGDDQCQSGICSVDGVCCDTRCEAGCEACLGDKTGGVDGSCLPVQVGTNPDVECDDGNPCTVDACDGSGGCLNFAAPFGTTCGDANSDSCSNADTCDGSGNCIANDLPAGTACGGAPDACSLQDTCNGSGACVDNGYTNAGTACGDPATECSEQDTCDGAGSCLDNDLAPGTGCGDPGTECTLRDTCDGTGSCVDNGFAAVGASCGSPATACSEQDTCNGAGSCQVNHRSSGTTCGDAGDECTVQDLCDGSGRCTDNGFISAGTTCGDPANECSGQDTCNGTGSCQPNDLASGSTCGDPGNECTLQDTCDGTGSCSDNGFLAAGTSCGDAGTECTVQDTCNGTGTCSDNGFQPSGSSCGDPGDECTVQDTCNGAGSCADNGFRASGTTCGDPASECSGQDTCNGSGACQANDLTLGTSCGDAGTECTVQDTCNGTGACNDNGFRASGTTCGDPATECSAQDTCNGAGSCQENDLSVGTSCGDAGDECTVQDTCNGDGACLDNGFLSAGTTCGSALDSECTNPDACDGSGTCLANDAASGTTCGDTGDACTVQDTCTGSGTCADNGFRPSGTTCGDQTDDACTDPDTCDGSGTCQGNHASSGTDCGDAGSECVVQDECNGFGVCRNSGFIPAGTPCGDTSDTECTNPDTCDGSGTCADNNASVGAACGDAGSECTVQDTCDASGQCADQGFRPSGTTCGDPTSNSCTAADSCNGAGTCADNDMPAGTSCGDTGTECVNQDTCDGSGACSDQGFAESGTTCGDATDTECNNPDSCNGAGVCRPNYEISGTSCGDAGSACVSQDTCNGSGSCRDNGYAPAGTVCESDDNQCTDDECNGFGGCLHDANQAPCDDGFFCNGNDTCSGGSCTIHTGDPCPGPDADTNCSETCNEAADACSASDPDGSSCDDRLFCNGTEVCSGGVCESENIDPCPNGGAYGGDDDSNCSESCDEFANTCTFPDPDGMPCNDALFCTGADVGNVCTQDSDCRSLNCADVCDGPDAGTPCAGNDDCPNGGRCAARACASEVFAIDGTDITIEQDYCVAGSCQGGAPPCPGDSKDGLARGVGLSASCNDACEESTSSCTAVSDDDLDCRDDDYCNGEFDSCQAGVCERGGDPCGIRCAQGSNPNDPNDPCSLPENRFQEGDLDSDCSESCADNTACSGYGCLGVGSCTAQDDNNTDCSDGTYCNGTDKCSSGACTIHAGDPCPGADGDIDCSERCNEAADNCTTNDPVNSGCNDGLFCTATDRCNVDGVCVGSGTPCQGADGDNDCTEQCREANDDCEGSDPENSTCNDARNCTLTDRCNATGICVGSVDPCQSLIDDGTSNDCTEGCRENGGTYACDSNNPSGKPCNDGLFCTTSSTCNGSGSCVGSGNPCDGVDGDSDCSEQCREANDDCNGNDSFGSTCTSNGRACDGTERCNGSGLCQSPGICCTTGTHRFSVTSSDGGSVDPAEWPGGRLTINVTPNDSDLSDNAVTTCRIQADAPLDNIDQVGIAADGGWTGFPTYGDCCWEYIGQEGFAGCTPTGGQDGDGCETPSCPPAGIGECQDGRPSCSAALNGRGTGRFRVDCTDPE